jgi:hypothetical protein
MKIVSEPKDRQTATRLLGVMKSLVKTGFINGKELPEKMTIEDALKVVNDITNQRGLKECF